MNLYIASILPQIKFSVSAACLPWRGDPH